MNYILDGIAGAFGLIASLDPEFLGIVGVSVAMALLSTLLAALVGIPLGVLHGALDFRGRRAADVLLNTLLSLPTVLIGLVVFALISRSGPLGSFGLLYTRGAVVAGQTILIVPLVAALTAAAIRSLDPGVGRTLSALGAGRADTILALAREARVGIYAALVASFGRVFSEVGIAMMLGGNIRHYTRTVTTAIALETARGEFALGIALGLVLLFIALCLSTAPALLRRGR